MAISFPAFYPAFPSASVQSAKELGLSLQFLSHEAVAEVSSFLGPQSLLWGPYKRERSCPSTGEDALVGGDSCFAVSPALLTAQSAFGALPPEVTQAGSWQQRCAALPAVLADANRVN